MILILIINKTLKEMSLTPTDVDSLRAYDEFWRVTSGFVQFFAYAGIVHLTVTAIPDFRTKSDTVHELW